MNNLTERNWVEVPMGVELKKLMGTFVNIRLGTPELRVRSSNHD